MREYNEKDLLRLAKRYNNEKRKYLLVNPLQAKHMPVNPAESLNMMRALGNMLADKYPETDIIIGFAETATAIGAAVCDSFGNNCFYLHTTREEFDDDADFICFNEEHSHAVKQTLNISGISQMINEGANLLLVEDEISTGNTLLNIIQNLRNEFPNLKNRTITVASLINRTNGEDAKKLADTGIVCEALLKLNNIDYSGLVDYIYTEAPVDAKDILAETVCQTIYINAQKPLLNPRNGVYINTYRQNIDGFTNSLSEQIKKYISTDDNILLLGTEEFMYPVLKLGEKTEQSALAKSVKCHATTRSPIGTYNGLDYPITFGVKLRSFYDSARPTYIYNLDYYDKVIVITDSKARISKAVFDLKQALSYFGCEKLIIVKG